MLEISGWQRTNDAKGIPVHRRNSTGIYMTVHGTMDLINYIRINAISATFINSLRN